MSYMVSTDMQYGQFSLEPNCAAAALPLPPGAETWHARDIQLRRNACQTTVNCKENIQHTASTGHRGLLANCAVSVAMRVTSPRVALALAKHFAKLLEVAPLTKKRKQPSTLHSARVMTRGATQVTTLNKVPKPA